MMRTLFLRACRLRGAEDFFVDPGERVSGHAAQDGALKLAAGLAAQGIACGDRVALLCRSSVRHALAYFACLVRGAVACNLHVREAPQRLAETLAWLDAKLMLYDADLEPLARDIAAAGGGCASLALDAAGIARLQAAGRFDPQRAPLAPEALAAIVLSSGTTGRPNGVMHSQATLAENARGAQPCYLGITPHDSTLVLMNPSFAAWPNIVLGHVGAAAKTVFAANFTPQGFLETLARERVTMAPLVPTMWRLVLDEDIAAHDLSCLRLATISGEPPAQRDLERIVGGRLRLRRAGDERRPHGQGQVRLDRKAGDRRRPARRRARGRHRRAAARRRGRRDRGERAVARARLLEGPGTDARALRRRLVAQRRHGHRR